jgi:hypothetical protein
MKKLVAIGFIWLGCAIAWMVLGSTLMVRSGETSSDLVNEVHSLWGPPIEQGRPRAFYHDQQMKTEKVTTKDTHGNTVESEVARAEDVAVEFPVDASDVAVALDLAHRQKGLLWFPTYRVDFRARYAFQNPTREPRRVDLRFPLSSEHAVYDGFEITAPGGAPIAAAIADGEAAWTEQFAPGERREYLVGYRTRGTTRWGYQLAAGGRGSAQVKNFHLALDTNFADVDFPAGTISPSVHARTARGWHGDWTFSSLVGTTPIGLELPQKTNPGPLAARITFFAPVGLLFFFFVVAVLAMAQRREIHPLNFFLFGCAFFAFHLLFGYLVDHLAILPAFTLSSLVSIALVSSYARLFVGWRFALREMAGAQLIYLVLFSFTFFWTGFTGLAITVGAILTLFVMMQVTGRVKWGSASANSTSAQS